MEFPRFQDISDWKDFERLCADLLSAEGFILESEPFVDRTGCDLLAVEEYRSHDPSRVISLRWRIQCKHYSSSGKNLGRKEVEESLYNFEVTRKADEGLFLIVDTDYSEPAKEVVDMYISSHPHGRVTLWNQRQLAARVERHPHLLTRYGLSAPKIDYTSRFAFLKRLTPVRTLMVSDQSPLAHNLTSALRVAGFDITFLPFWNYREPLSMELAKTSVLSDDFRLVICFLGDSFVLPMPEPLIDVVVRCHRRGASFLLFPFLAWSVYRGLYPSLKEILPVELQDPSTISKDLSIDRVAGSYRRGDFGWLLEFDSFAEDQYIELDPSGGILPFTNGIESRFGLSHSFEYLCASPRAQIAWKDTTGNPMVVTSDCGTGKVCYLNTCCHSCMSTVAISSPMEASAEAGILLKNIMQWLLE